ncbi:MAG: acyltransferase [Lachnospiraceae bacterium]|nr:acyltransferase [Lachnospiraceae bacterium]
MGKYQQIPTEKINYQFKVLYAIGICLVVSGHCGNRISLFYEFFEPYAFHLGLFVFASGYFYKEANEKNIKRYVIKKIKTLIVPLYLWNFFYAIIVGISFFMGFTIGRGNEGIIEKLFLMPIMHGHQFMYNLGGWFVIPLFMIEIYNIIFRKLCFFINGRKKEIINLILGIIIGFMGVYISNAGYNYGWWLVLTRMMCFMPFYVCGFFYHKYLEKVDNCNNLVYFSSILTVNLILSIRHGGVYAFTQVWSNYGGTNPIIVYTIAFLAIAFWLRISRILTPVLGKSKYINLIADNAYSIMINQFLGFMLIKMIFACICRETIYCQSFDYAAYYSDIYYYYFPKGLAQAQIIYMVSGIVIPIWMKKFIDNFRTYLKFLIAD